MAVQDSFETRPAAGLVGDLARPGEPHAYDFLPAQVPASGRKPRPGDAVYWDSTNNGAAVPASAANQLLVFGIVSYEQNRLPNSSGVIEYEDGEYMKVCVMGTVFITAGGACEYGDLMRYQHGDNKWDADNPGTTFSDTFYRSIECVSISGADGNVIEARIGMGRIR